MLLLPIFLAIVLMLVDFFGRLLLGDRTTQPAPAGRINTQVEFPPV